MWRDIGGFVLSNFFFYIKHKSLFFNCFIIFVPLGFLYMPGHYLSNLFQ